jgi:hypothetical protein
MCSTLDDKAADCAVDFGPEAEGLWTAERTHDSVLNMAAAQLLTLGLMGRGKDYSILRYLEDAVNMVTRMGLFGPQDGAMQEPVSLTTVAHARAAAQTAWGVFNWTV